MSSSEIPDELRSLVEKLRDEYRDSERAIAEALADAGEALSVEELVDRTGYTTRTVKKRIGTLEDRLGGEPLIRRDDEDRPSLHDAVVRALQDDE